MTSKHLLPKKGALGNFCFISVCHVFVLNRTVKHVSYTALEKSLSALNEMVRLTVSLCPRTSISMGLL